MIYGGTNYRQTPLPAYLKGQYSSISSVISTQNRHSFRHSFVIVLVKNGGKKRLI